MSMWGLSSCFKHLRYTFDFLSIATAIYLHRGLSLFAFMAFPFLLKVQR